MTEEIQAPEETVEEAHTLESLTHRHSGVICPHCKGTAFSTSKYKYDTCKCGSTYIMGAQEYMRYGTHAPYDISDIRVTSVRIDPTIDPEQELHDDIAEELGATRVVVAEAADEDADRLGEFKEGAEELINEIMSTEKPPEPQEPQP